MILRNLLESLHLCMLMVPFFFFSFAGLNTKVCTAASLAQFLLWAVWAVMTKHPSCFKILFVIIGNVFSIVLETYDIPPRWDMLMAVYFVLLFLFPSHISGGNLPRKTLRCALQQSSRKQGSVQHK